MERCAVFVVDIDDRAEPHSGGQASEADEAGVGSGPKDGREGGMTDRVIPALCAALGGTEGSLTPVRYQERHYLPPTRDHIRSQVPLRPWRHHRIAAR